MSKLSSSAAVDRLSSPLFRPAIFLAVLLSSLVYGQAQSLPLVIEGGTLIDGTGAPPLSDAVILIEGSRISEVGRKGQVVYPSGARIIDAREKFILPGLINGHVHYKDWSGELYLAHGVTTVVDLGNVTEWILAQKEGIAKGKIRGPRILASGNAIHGPFRENDFRRRHHTEVTNADEARRVTRSLIAQGVDVIKLRENLISEMLRAIIEEAHGSGIPALGHAPDAWQAVEVGYDEIVHTSGIARTMVTDPQKRRMSGHGSDLHAFMDFQEVDRLVEKLATQRIYLNPTVRHRQAWAYKKRFQHEDFDLLFNNPALRYVPLDFRLGIVNRFNFVGLYLFQDLSRQEKQLNLQAQRNLLELIRRFVKAGGRICTGTDTNATPGQGLHQELQILVEDVGLSPGEALLTVTRYPAELFRVDEDLGSVQRGKLADLIVVRENPLTDIRNARNIEMVFKEGKMVDIGYHPEFTNPIPKSTPEDTSLIFPSPVIRRVAPLAVIEGDRKVILTLSGTGFIPYSMVQFDRTKVATEFVSRFELKARIPDHLLEQAGTFPVVVTNPRPIGTVFAPGQSELQHFGLRGATSNEGYLIVRFR